MTDFLIEGDKPVHANALRIWEARPEGATYAWVVAGTRGKSGTPDDVFYWANAFDRVPGASALKRIRFHL
jgi:hypothetical protein